MIKKILFIFGGIVIGLLLGYTIILYSPKNIFPAKSTLPLSSTLDPESNQVIGFLPYWLTDKAQTDYSKDITTLAYFSLTIGEDGSIVKMTTPQSEEPGWNALQSGKMDPFFAAAKKNGVKLSLVLDSGDNEAIDRLMDDPKTHAENLLNDVLPLMKQYGFTDLNLDVESTNLASPEAQLRFFQFADTLKHGLYTQNAGTFTVEISGTDLIKQDLINPKNVALIADHIVIMAYDFHYIGSYVTGPVAPLYGGGSVAEYDIQTALQQALRIMPANEIILGVPLYGYQWETIDNTPRSAIVPDSGLVVSGKTVEDFLNSCATCSAQLDNDAQEEYVIYKDQDSGTYHQIFYPDENSMTQKINFANNNNLGGIALWALGYEDSTILKPLETYK
ncbi:MAG TPA: glycosyl hydrolase family 18 protein [Patescibacteria group bacterium]|nr:glycosyl hydrolase family 18 protein [Patescibacteria group bacterium]